MSIEVTVSGAGDPIIGPAQNQTGQPSGSRHRDGYLVVVYLGRDAIRIVNREVKHISRLSIIENPDATLLPHITDMVGVFDLTTRSFHLIMVHRLDWRGSHFPTVRNVVVFSEPPYAVVRTEKLQLATPAYYRRGNLKPGTTAMISVAGPPPHPVTRSPPVVACGIRSVPSTRFTPASSRNRLRSLSLAESLIWAI